MFFHTTATSVSRSIQLLKRVGVRRISLMVSWLALVLAISACASPGKGAHTERALQIMAERCRVAGEYIHSTVRDVDGIVLLKPRVPDLDFSDQYLMNDPYGRDGDGKGYIVRFLRGESRQLGVAKEGEPQRKGYKYVQARETDGSDWKNYTGAVEFSFDRARPQSPPSSRFVSFEEPIQLPTARYGVSYEDISTREDRDHWIAGSRLSVIDRFTGEVLAERVGYMVDMGFGSRVNGRRPWLHAADHACPSFDRFPGGEQRQKGFSMQFRQTADFVEKVLLPVD